MKTKHLIEIFYLTSFSLFATLCLSCTKDDVSKREHSKGGELPVKLTHRNANNNHEDVFPLDLRVKIQSTFKMRFGNIDKILYDESDSLLFILDRYTTPGIYLYNIKGEFIRKIGQAGQGPGEYINPQDICLLPGKQIALVERAGRRCNIYTYDGYLLQSFLLEDGEGGLIYPSNGIFLPGYLIVYRGYAPNSETPQFYAYDLKGALRNKWGSPEFYHGIDVSVASEVMGTVDDYLFKADLYEPRVTIYSKKGQIQKEFLLEYSSPEKAREYEKFKKRYFQLAQQDRGRIGVALERITFLHLTSDHIFITTPIFSKIILLFDRQGNLLYKNDFSNYWIDLPDGSHTYSFPGDLSSPMGEIALFIFEPVGRWSKGAIMAAMPPLPPTSPEEPWYEIRLYRYPDLPAE